MDGDRHRYAGGDDVAAGGRMPGSDPLGAYGLSLDVVVRVAAAEVDGLIAELEPSLDARQRQLLHQLRLAAESLGTIRASASLMGTWGDPSRPPPRSDR